MSPLDVYAALRFALAAVLYVFFGVLLWLWWRSERQTSAVSTTQLDAALVVIDAGQTSLRAEQVFNVGAVCAIGRAPTADVVIADDGASLEHAVIHRREGRWWIEDLASKNGTWVNRALLERACPLRAGDMIAIAGVTLKFSDAPDRARSPA